MADPIEVGEDALTVCGEVYTVYNVRELVLERNRRLAAEKTAAPEDTHESTVTGEVVKPNVTDEITPGYSRDEMMRIQEGKEYSWQCGGDEDSLAVMSYWLHDEKRKRSRVSSEEYWIWHNTNAQHSFARHFGFFPLHLPHFDTAAFAEAARKDSPVLRYLRSGLFKVHVTMREMCDGPLTQAERTNCERMMDIECPSSGYSRDEVMALGKSKQAPNKNLCAYLDKRAFASVRNENNEGIFSRGHMLMIAGYPGYNWNTWNDNPEYSGLTIMERHFPGGSRKKKMANTEYWIWHNVNAQQSFAVYFGFFPFHMPHFDAVSFISIARSESLVQTYLISSLYQQHLIMRKYKEDVPYMKEYEDEQRRKMMAAYQKVKKFPPTDQHSEVHYEDPDRNLRKISVEQAQASLRSGIFSSGMKFAVVPKGESVKDKEWMVYKMNDLIARNGRSMPFLFYLPSHTEKINEVEAINEMREEERKLADIRAEIMMQLENIRTRSAAVCKDMERIATKFPTLACRSGQTNATIGLAAKVETFEPSHPQLLPKPGVDPFAMLKTIQKESSRKIIGEAEIVNQLDQLRKRFDRCDKKALVLRTTNMINKSVPAWCHLCDLKTESASTLIEHITCRKHMNKITVMCSDALDFWFDAIEKVTKKSSEPELSPLTILSFCARLANPCPSLEQAADRMHRKLRSCDKKILDGEPALRALFSKPVSCSVCIRRVFIDKPANLIAHFTTQGHITAASKGGGQMHAEVIDYWMRALDRATVAATNY